MNRRTLYVAAFAVLLVGCPELGSQEPTTSGEIPENPTWSDVKPVLDKVCNDCHAVPPGDGGTGVPAPGTLRLDVCETVGGIPGAKSQAPRIIVRVVDKLPTPMPPDNYSPQPTPDDIEIMRRWAEDGGPCGGSSPNNQTPNNQTPNNQATNNQTPNSTVGDMGMGGMDTGVNNGVDMGMDMPVDMGPPPPPLADVVDMLQTQCSGCHGNNGGRGNLEILADATDMEVAMALQGNAMDPAGVPFVTPNDPEQSALFLRMDADADFMPPGEALPDQTQLVADWINGGAPGF